MSPYIPQFSGKPDGLCNRDCPDRRVGCREGCERWQEHMRLNEERKRRRREAMDDDRITRPELELMAWKKHHSR